MNNPIKTIKQRDLNIPLTDYDLQYFVWDHMYQNKYILTIRNISFQHEMLPKPVSGNCKQVVKVTGSDLLGNTVNILFTDKMTFLPMDHIKVRNNLNFR